MQCICNRRYHYNFSIACQFQIPWLTRTVHQVYPPYLNVVLGRNNNLSMCFNIEVTAPELCTPLGKNGLIIPGLLTSWLVGCGPETTIFHIPDKTEITPIITCGVLTLTSNRNILPSAIATSCMGHHHMVISIG